MTPNIPHSSRAGRFGELALWTVAGLVVLTGHIAAAAVLLRQETAPPADQGPPAAIMIELAAEPEAVNTEEDQVAEDMTDSQEIVSKQMDPVEEPPPEPTPEPVEPPPPEEIVEPVEPEPEPVEPEPVEQPEPEPEITETIPEPPPEPVEEIDPLEQQMIAALENVEVPLPISRPPPPPEPKKEPPKRVRKQPQASKATREAKVQTKQSDRTAASRTSEGRSVSSVSPTTWRRSVHAEVARAATSRRCPGHGNVSLSLRIDGSGGLASVSVTRSSGDSQVDDYVASAAKRASPFKAPPAGNNGVVPLSFLCKT